MTTKWWPFRNLRRSSKTLVDTSPSDHPTIYTASPDGGMGRVPEWARLQAALNMKNDPAKMRMAIEMLGEAEARRRYPEGFDD